MDFVDTEFLTPDNGNCNEQYFMVSGTIWPIGVNKICGINPGEYISGERKFFTYLKKGKKRPYCIWILTASEFYFFFGLFVTKKSKMSEHPR